MYWHSCCNIAVFVIILQSQISPSFGSWIPPQAAPTKATNWTHGCIPRWRFLQEQLIPDSTNKSLTSILTQCTINTDVALYERYANKTFCSCAKVVEERISFDKCDQTFRSNFSVAISVKNVRNRWGENCTFTFLFRKHKQVTATLRILPEKIATRFV